MYQININTLAIVPYEDNKTNIIENNKNIIFNSGVKTVINDNCCYFGSSYEGRRIGTKKIIGVNYKAPIIIEESADLVFFPTTSPRLNECIWLSLKNIKDYKKNGKKTILTFVNDSQIIINMSYNSFDNQILRAARLQMMLKNRKIFGNF